MQGERGEWNMASANASDRSIIPAVRDEGSYAPGRRADARLGEILVKQGLITQAGLERAWSQEAAKRGRLGTYLVETDLLTSDQLALGLAELLGVAPALDADFARADASLRKRLVVHQAIELQAIPLFSSNGKRIAVAMANPTNRNALDRLAFILGATVDPMVTSEVALNRQFELLYRVRRKRAKTLLPSMLSGAQPAGPAPTAASASTGAGKATVGPPPLPKDWQIRPALRSHRQAGPPPAGARPAQEREPAQEAARPAPRSKGAAGAVRLAPLAPGQAAREPGAPAVLMEDAACFTPTPLTFIPPRICDPPIPSRVLARHPLTPVVVPITGAGTQLAVEQIRFASDQQDLSDNLFTFMRTCFSAGAMFVVTGAVAQGRFGFAGGRVRPEVERLRIPLGLPSCLRIARSRRANFRGAPPPDGGAVHAPLWAALGTDSPSDVLVSPVIVDGQVTLLLYAQGDPGSRILSVAAARIEQVREALGSSLLRLAV